MIGRRAIVLALLLAVVCAGAWGQAVTISPTSLPVGGGQFTIGQQIPTQQLRTNFNDLNAWSISAGSLPPGLNLDPVAGTITGTPTLAGAFTFTVSVFDQELQRQGIPQQYTVYVNTGSPLTLTPLKPPPPGGAVGGNYASFAFQVAGGVPGYTWALQSGTSVNGLKLNASTGLLSGIPQAGGVFPIGITVSDASGAQVSASFNLNVLGISTPPLPGGGIGVPYSQTLTSVGATGPVTWSLGTTGPLPPGLALDPVKGVISGTPTLLGTFPFQVSVTDTAAKLTATQAFSINITSILTVTTTSPLPNGVLGVVYSQTLQASGGTAPYTWSATGLPTWLTLDPATGILSGTPTAGGTSTIAVTVTDAARGTATANLSLTVGALVITPATLPSGTVGVPYPATTLTVAGATVASWTVTVGTLPAGLALDSSTGIISGKPTTAGSSTFTITASFGNRAAVATVVQAFTLVINPLPTLTITGLPTTGVASTQPAATVSLSGGTYPLNITGTMTLTFAPASGGAQPFDAKFASGPPYTANFTITPTPPGNTANVPVMIGTVAGTITITTTNVVDSNGNSIPPPAPVVMTVIPTPPVIKSVIPCAVTLNGFSISVTGYSTPRDMASALFHFTLPTNTQPSTLDVTVPLTTAFAAWYSSPTSNTFGSTFKMTAQFSFTGPPGSTVPFIALTATLTNSKGTSTPPVAGQSSVATCP
jgi:Putative Ig domain